MKNFIILCILVSLSGCSNPTSSENQSNQKRQSSSKKQEIPFENQPDIRGIVSSVFDGGINVARIELQDSRKSPRENREGMRQRFRDMSDKEREIMRDEMIKNATKRKEIRFTENTEFFEGLPWEESIPIDSKSIQPHRRINIWLDENEQAQTIFMTPFPNKKPNEAL